MSSRNLTNQIHAASSLLTPQMLKKEKNTVRGSVLAGTDVIKYYKIDINAPAPHRQAWQRYMLIAGTSTSELISEWKTYLLSYTFAQAPSLEAHLAKSGYAVVTVPEATLARLAEWFITARTHVENLPDQETAESVASSAAVRGHLLAIANFPGMPVPNIDIPLEHSSLQLNSKICVGHWSLVLFLMGKRIQGEDHTSIEVRRPKAVIEKASLPATVFSLNGEGKLSQKAHIGINSAWGELASLREIVIKEFAKIATHSNNIEEDILFTTIRLLQFNGLSYVAIILSFLTTYPWAASLPQLRPSVQKFMSSFEALKKYDSAIRPYVKLIHADRVNIFPRKELEALITVAVSAAQDQVGAGTLSDYYIDSAYGPVVEAFKKELEHRERVEKAKKTKELRDIEGDRSEEEDESSSDDYESEGSGEE